MGRCTCDPSKPCRCGNRSPKKSSPGKRQADKQLPGRQQPPNPASTETGQPSGSRKNVRGKPRPKARAAAQKTNEEDRQDSAAARQRGPAQRGKGLNPQAAQGSEPPQQSSSEPSDPRSAHQPTAEDRTDLGPWIPPQSQLPYTSRGYGEQLDASLATTSFSTLSDASREVAAESWFETQLEENLRADMEADLHESRLSKSSIYYHAGEYPPSSSMGEVQRQMRREWQESLNKEVEEAMLRSQESGMTSGESISISEAQASGPSINCGHESFEDIEVDAEEAEAGEYAVLPGRLTQDVQPAQPRQGLIRNPFPWPRRQEAQPSETLADRLERLHGAQREGFNESEYMSESETEAMLRRAAESTRRSSSEPSASRVDLDSLPENPYIWAGYKSPEREPSSSSTGIESITASHSGSAEMTTGKNRKDRRRNP